MNDKIETLLTELSLEEKVSLLAGSDVWTTVPVKRLGIPSMTVTDGPNGARGRGASAGPPSACFPVGVALGATWNSDLVRRIAEALADEVKTKGAHILLAPTVNIHRSPLAGRNFECYSEDPYLTSRLAVAYIQGLQGQEVGACIKHFVCNDSEFERLTISSEVRERALREIYLPPFKAAVKEAQTWTVMSSYNKVNGTWASENPYLLRTILKEEWGFDGIVISDWFGTNSLQVANGGLDLEMPGPARWMGDRLLDAVAAGDVSEDIIDDKVRRILRTLFRVGAFDQPEPRQPGAKDDPQHRQLIREAAGEAMVLLTNRANVLPLNAAELDSLAIIGPNARQASIMGGGSSSVTPHYVIKPYDGIVARVGGSLEVSYAVGCTKHKLLPSLDAELLSTPNGRQGGLLVEYFNTAEPGGSPVATQVSKTTYLTWFGGLPEGVNSGAFSLRMSGRFVPEESGRHTFGLISSGMSRLMVDGTLQIDHWREATQESYFDMGREEAVVEIEMQAGQSYEIRVDYSSQKDTTWNAVKLGCLPPIPDNPIAEAAELAGRSSAAIVFVGLSSEWESEGFDRPDLELPGAQAALIEAVAAANEKTIVVVNSGSPVSMPWLDKVAAVIQAWYPGQEAGNAIADILFGEVNPSGKLPYTHPRRLQDNPAFINYPGENGQVHYGEGIFVGYRYYDKKEIEPLFPFGHGLSYTAFEYSNLSLNADAFGPGDEIQVSLDVTNVGERPGKEIVQLYVRDPESSLVRPEKELKGFAKVSLNPGETRRLQLSLSQDDLAFYDPLKAGWVAETGRFEVLVGSSSRDIRLRGQFHWQANATAEPGKKARLHTGLTLKELMEDEDARRVLEKHFSEWVDYPQADAAMEFSLDKLATIASTILTPKLMQTIEEELAKFS